MEGVLISGVALDTDEAKVTLERVPDRPGVAATVFKAIADDGDLDRHDRAERVARGGDRPLVHRAAGRPSSRPGVMERLVKEIGADSYTIDDDIARCRSSAPA